MLNPKLTYHVMGLEADPALVIDNFKDIAVNYSNNTGALDDYSKLKTAILRDNFICSSEKRGPFALIKKLVINMFGLNT